MPLFLPAYRHIPYLTGQHKPYFARIITHMLQKVQCHE